MRHKIYFILLFVALTGAVQAQCPGPAQRTALINLQKAIEVESTRAGQIGLTDTCGNQRYQQYVEINLDTIGYTPTSTGNTLNLSEFVIAPGGNVYYIDWQGNSIMLGGGGADPDMDWLEIADNNIPDNINDSIYTYKYASVGARLVWPGAQLLVNDSINAALEVIQGNRNARIALYDNLNETWTMLDHGGAAPTLYMPEGADFNLRTGSGTPQNPFTETNHFGVNSQDSTIRFFQYPDTRRDTQEINNFLYTDNLGKVRSQSIDSILPDQVGVEWTGRSVPEGVWSNVTYGNGLFVAVASSGTNRVMTSVDGISWTVRTAAELNLWLDVTYGNGLFVAVAFGGTNRVMTSPDGITWTAQAAAEANNWRSVTYGNGLFVAVASSGTNRVMTSPDGVTWTAQAAAEANGWEGITYANGLFVSVASTGTNRVMTSPDGITWTAYAAAEANSWKDVMHGNGLFVAVASSGTNRVMTSPDGVTWTAQAAPEATTWIDIAFGNGLFVAVADDVAATFQVMTSGKQYEVVAQIIAQGGGGGTNIYNSDGDIPAGVSRVVSMDTVSSLLFVFPTNDGGFEIYGGDDSTGLNSYVLMSDESASNFFKVSSGGIVGVCHDGGDISFSDQSQLNGITFSGNNLEVKSAGLATFGDYAGTAGEWALEVDQVGLYAALGDYNNSGTAYVFLENGYSLIQADNAFIELQNDDIRVTSHDYAAMGDGNGENTGMGIDILSSAGTIELGDVFGAADVIVRTDVNNQSIYLISDSTFTSKLLKTPHLTGRLYTPGISVEAAAGSGASASIVTAQSSDLAGRFSVTTGTAAAFGLWATVTFEEPFSVAPIVIVGCENNNCGKFAGSYYVNVSTTGFEFFTGEVAGVEDLMTYEMVFHTIGGK